MKNVDYIRGGPVKPGSVESLAKKTTMRNLAARARMGKVKGKGRKARPKED